MATTTSPLDDYIPRRELAQQLGKSTRTLDRWQLERRGPRRTKIGKSIFYHVSHVSEWLERQTEETVSA